MKGSQCTSEVECGEELMTTTTVMDEVREVVSTQVEGSREMKVSDEEGKNSSSSEDLDGAAWVRKEDKRQRVKKRSAKKKMAKKVKAKALKLGGQGKVQVVQDDDGEGRKEEVDVSQVVEVQSSQGMLAGWTEDMDGLVLPPTVELHRHYVSSRFPTEAKLLALVQDRSAPAELVLLVAMADSWFDPWANDPDYLRIYPASRPIHSALRQTTRQLFLTDAPLTKLALATAIHCTIASDTTLASLESTRQWSPVPLPH